MNTTSKQADKRLNTFINSLEIPMHYIAWYVATKSIILPLWTSNDIPVEFINQDVLSHNRSLWAGVINLN